MEEIKDERHDLREDFLMLEDMNGSSRLMKKRYSLKIKEYVN